MSVKDAKILLTGLEKARSKRIRPSPARMEILAAPFSWPHAFRERAERIKEAGSTPEAAKQVASALQAEARASSRAGPPPSGTSNNLEP